MNQNLFLQSVIDLSKISFAKGHFPAGAMVVKNDEIISQSESGIFPATNHHAESDAIDKAMSLLNIQLNDCILFCSMEPCLMCLSRAYWSGIRKIIYALKKESVDHHLAYEGSHSNEALLKQFNFKIELIHVPSFEPIALKIYNDWIKSIENGD